MRARLLSLLIVLFYSTLSFAQLQFSDSLRVSLLTVADGEDAYECFGHTGLRVTDLKNNTDIVFHYGVYNYTEPNFIWHFVEGKCNYSMGACYANDFFHQHQRRRLNIVEQKLCLDSAQNVNLVQALVENYAPQNRHYRYNFFFDNCATRPFDMINRWTNVQYDTTYYNPVITLRDMIQEKTGKGNWLDFGISIAVAGRADQTASFREQMFLPSYLCMAITHATNNGNPLVQEVVTHNYSNKEEYSSDSLFSPLITAFIFAFLAIALMIKQNREIFLVGQYQKSTYITSSIFDSVWLFVTGVAGCIIWFLNFYSEHPAVDNNLNCLWLLPTNLLFMAIIWIKKAENVCRIYFFIIFAAEIIYIISVCMSAQYIHPAFIPLLIGIAARAKVRIGVSFNLSITRGNQTK